MAVHIQKREDWTNHSTYFLEAPFLEAIEPQLDQGQPLNTPRGWDKDFSGMNQNRVGIMPRRRPAGK